MSNSEIFEDDKYPLVSQTCKEIKNFSEAFGVGYLPKEYVVDHLNTAIAFVDGTQENLEAILLGCVLQGAAFYLGTNPDYFEIEYPQFAKEMIDCIRTRDENIIMSNPILQQANAVNRILECDLMLKSLADGKFPESEISELAIISKRDFYTHADKLPELKQKWPKLFGALDQKLDQVMAGIKSNMVTIARLDSGHVM